MEKHSQWLPRHFWCTAHEISKLAPWTCLCPRPPERRRYVMMIGFARDSRRLVNTSGMLRQLDYILIRRKWRTSVLNAEPYSTFDSVGSDHRVVSMRVRPSRRGPKPSPKIHHDWKTFSGSPDHQARYTVEVRNRFQLLDTEEGPSTVYERFVVANVEATRECVPKKERTRISPRSRHPEVMEARAMVEEARQSFDRK